LSLISENIYDTVRKILPGLRITKEYYVKFKNKKLFFDFYIADLSLLVEVQGIQHVEFVKHFHGNKEKFLEQRYRDNLKIEYTENSNKSLVRFYYDEIITEDLVMLKFNKVFDKGGFYEWDFDFNY